MRSQLTGPNLNLETRPFGLDIGEYYKATYSPHIIIHILLHLSEKIFEAYVSNADYNSEPVYFTEKNKRTSGIIQEYDKKEPGVFTFDGIRFFKVNNIATTRNSEGRLVFTFEFINTPSFSERNTAFMIMPFGNNLLNEFYARNIREFLASSDLEIKVIRSDDFKGTDVVADTILSQIEKAEFVICDITNCNKNVFFEIGYAKAKNKNMIFLLEQNKPAEFFDVAHIRRIEYNYDREIEFRQLLKDTLISIRDTNWR